MAEQTKKKVGRPAGTRALKEMRLANGLTLEQEAYCRGRVMGMSVEEALIVANAKVKPKTAAAWEKSNPQVIARLQELTVYITDRAIMNTGLNREWVMSRLMTVVERCMEAEPVMVEGKPSGEFTFDSRGANQALKLLGDTMGMFKPVEKKPGDEFNDYTDEDLARIAGELEAQLGTPLRLEGTATPAQPQQVVNVQAIQQAV